MMEYVCIKDLYMYNGDKVFTKGKRYTNIHKGRDTYLEFIDDDGDTHEVSDGSDFDDENWIIHFVKLQDYGDYLINVAKEYSDGVFTWYPMNAPKTPSMSKEDLLAHFIQNGVINIEEYLELSDKLYTDVVNYIFKKSNKLNKKMEYYMCVEDVPLYSGTLRFKKGQIYLNSCEDPTLMLSFIDEQGRNHSVTGGAKEYFKKVNTYYDILLENIFPFRKKESVEEGKFEWKTLSNKCYWGLSDEYLEDVYLKEAYKKKKSNKLNKEMEELKITKEKVLAASKLGSKEKEVLETLFPKVFEDGYFEFGKEFKITTFCGHDTPLFIGWGLVDVEQAGKILLVKKGYHVEVLNNVGAGEYIGLKFKKRRNKCVFK